MTETSIRTDENLQAYQDGGLPLELQVVVQAKDLPVGGDGHHHLLARSHDQLSRRRIYVASCQGHYMHACTSAPNLGLMVQLQPFMYGCLRAASVHA